MERNEKRKTLRKGRTENRQKGIKGKQGTMENEPKGIK